MKTIKKVIPSSRNGDTSALLSRILKAFAKNDWSSDSYLVPVIEKLTVVDTQLTEALQRLKMYSQLAVKDDVRDEAIRSLFKLVEGYAYIPVTEMKEAAFTMNNVLEQYGLSILNEDYAEETANIESLINDLGKPDIEAAAAKLQGVPESIETIQAAQKEFEKLVMQQVEGEAAKRGLASASQLKKEGIREINNNLVAYLNTMAKVKPDTYEATAKTIAELIDDNNELVKRRRKTNEPDTQAV